MAFDLSRRDLELWLEDTIKMLLIVYDAQKETAYFIDLQPYFKENRISIGKDRKFMRVYIPVKNVFTQSVVSSFRQSNSIN